MTNERRTEGMSPNAQRLFGKLVALAECQELETYAELAAEMGLASSLLFDALCEIRDWCHVRGLPWLNALAVKEGKRQPGAGFVHPSAGKPSRRQRVELFEQHRDAAYAYEGWRGLLGERGETELDEDLSAGAAPDQEGYFEGRLVLREHYDRERRRDVLAKARARWAALGALCCEVCGFDFERAYGPHGAGFIEAHHRLPLASLPASGGTTRIQDLAPVCANCHRMIHLADPPLTPEALATLMRSQGLERASTT